ncbi:MAG: CHC2 zinc finger domain-containing protein [Hyphomicrobiales bacterium]|nr:CHC2 zinc finger domain-containing protein [Hyphomicrobiales bacterium]
MPPVDLADLKARVRLSPHVSRRVKLVGSRGGDLFGCCPFHDERTPSFSVNDAKGFFHCFGCGAHGDILDWWQKAEGMSFTDAVERLKREAGEVDRATPLSRAEPRDAETTRKQAEARALWEASSPIGGTIAATYLRQARRIAVELSDCLRFHPGLRPDPREPTEWPAMVAAVTSLGGDLVAIQRTFLQPDGSGKAPIDRPKRALGPVGLGAVRLGHAVGLVGLAEGIETGLSAMELFRVPVWCALGSNLARVTLPGAIKRVALFADRGAAGEAAAAKAAALFRSERRQVTVRLSPTGNDWNDHLRALRDGR